MQDQPVLEMVADHRWDRTETRRGRPAFPGGPPLLTFVDHCRCGAHSLPVSAAGLAHQWHDWHKQEVLEGRWRG